MTRPPSTRPPGRTSRPEASGPGRRPSTRDKMTVAEFCEDLGISRRTFHEWRAKGRAPKCLKLPNGDLRIRLADFDTWIERCEVAGR